MTVYRQLEQLIETMESKLEDARELSKSKYLNEYEEGVVDGVMETLVQTLNQIKPISSDASWDDNPEQMGR